MTKFVKSLSYPYVTVHNYRQFEFGMFNVNYKEGVSLRSLLKVILAINTDVVAGRKKLSYIKLQTRFWMTIQLI
jgi:hypothetical protein